MGEPPQQAISLFFFIQSFTFSDIILAVTMFALLIFSGLISGSEIAFFSMDPKDLEEIKQSDDPKSKSIKGLIDKPKKLLATILIANNFINVSVIILSTMFMNSVFDFVNYPKLGFLTQVVLVTFLILLIGEVIPKIYANKNSLFLAKLMAVPISFLGTVFSPLSKVLISSTSFIDKRFIKKTDNITVDELEHALDLTAEENQSQEENKILKGIVKFGNTSVKQIMTSRVDVASIDISENYTDLTNEIKRSGYSRIPVYENSFDSVKGVLYIKDLLPHLTEKSDFKWQNLIRKPFFVPENKKIDDLLKDFQDKKIHLAIVVDEYGGSSGIVTLEDVIEEIVGDISDEFDSTDLVYSKLDDNNYVFEGKILLNDFYKVLNLDDDSFEEEKGDSETLAGLLLEVNEKIPKKNDVIEFKGFSFKIEAADERKIKSVKVTKLDKSE